MNRRIRKLRQSFHYAVRGMRACMKTERNFRIHLTATVYVGVAAWIAGLDATRCAVLCLCFALMMATELLNTAIERLSDRQASCYDSLVREAKDIAAAAVFLCALFCVVIGLLFFVYEGAMWTVIAYLRANLWALGLFVVSLPAAAWFVFHYGANESF